MSDLEAAWARLKVGGDPGGGFVRLRLDGVKACAAYAARHAVEGTEALVLEVRTASIPPVDAYPEAAGFTVTVSPLEEGRAGSSRLVLALVEERFRDVFHSLVQDVVGVLGGVADEKGAVSAFTARLARWQAFLRQYGPDGLSLVARRGLFGEIEFLQRCLRSGSGVAGIVDSWKGYKGANHDFQFRRGNVEVKATSAVTPHAVHINNIKQLDDHGLESLHLCVVLVDEGEGGTESLPEKVEAIRKALGTPVRWKFDECLVEAGYLDKHAGRYASPRYSLRGIRCFRVEDRFPRLLDPTIPRGVENVEYLLALAACGPFEADVDSVIRHLTAGVLSNE